MCLRRELTHLLKFVKVAPKSMQLYTKLLVCAIDVSVGCGSNSAISPAIFNFLELFFVFRPLGQRPENLSLEVVRRPFQSLQFAVRISVYLPFYLFALPQIRRDNSYSFFFFFSELYPKIVPASMWTRRDIQEFKQEILSKQRECCIKVGSLATATVRRQTLNSRTVMKLNLWILMILEQRSSLFHLF